jgi:protein-disulfide isomerase/uncharacterized membrane protein
MRAGADRGEARLFGLLQGLRLCAVAGLGFSAAAAADYYLGKHAFCAPGGGCDAVRASAIGQSLGHALPALGLIGFALVLAAGLGRAPTLQLLGLAAAASGALAGLALLLLQAVSLRVFCPICVAADVAAVLAGALALPLLRVRTALPAPGMRGRSLWLLAGACAIALPAALALGTADPPSRVPDSIAALGRAGRINVVEISDFECPYCRALHPVLARAIASYATRVHFVRKVYPLPTHAHGRSAARAYLCAESMGRGEAMADRLFASRDLSAEGGARHAAALGLPLADFQRCIDDPATERRLERDIEAVRRSGTRGVPTVWIGDQRLEGFDPSTAERPYTAALERAARALR